MDSALPLRQIKATDPVERLERNRPEAVNQSKISLQQRSDMVQTLTEFDVETAEAAKVAGAVEALTY
jgi:hypothetical protein